MYEKAHCLQLKACGLLLIGLLLTNNFVRAQDTLSVLFIGNSYTAGNNLPEMVARCAEAHGDHVIHNQHLTGGATLNRHWQDRSTIENMLQQQNFDFVMIQAQSQEPSFSPAQVASDTYPFARLLDSLIRATSPCTETAFFMTWGRENGDASNCPFYPPVCTYGGMQQRLKQSYIEMAKDNNGICVPVGEVWKRVRNQFPTVDLYEPDGSHPNEMGSFLAASTMYSTLFQKRYVDSIPIVRIQDHLTQLAVQQLVSPAVFDSLEVWNIDTTAPSTVYGDSTLGWAYTVWVESSSGDFSIWSWGDGSEDDTLFVGDTLTHVFQNNSIYSVSVTTVRNCASGVYDYSWQPPTSVHDREIELFELNSIQVLNMNGQLILKGPPTILERARSLPEGIYLLLGKKGDAELRKKVYLGGE
jgi:hypothetical protein